MRIILVAALLLAACGSDPVPQWSCSAFGTGRSGDNCTAYRDCFRTGNARRFELSCAPSGAEFRCNCIEAGVVTTSYTSAECTQTKESMATGCKWDFITQ